MTTTDPSPTTLDGPAPRLPGRQKSPARIVASFAAWEYLRNVRMIESTFFIVVLPTVLYLMFGALASYSGSPVGHGTVSAYNMTAMTVYGATMATSAIAGSAALERQQGWGRQLGLTGLTGSGYMTGKVLVALGMAVLPIIVVFTAGALTGAAFDQPWMWFASGGLALLGSIPFALYGLGAALLFRSEAAVSAASGLLVVLAFFGNLFIPLTGTLLDIARFTPVYGITALTRWPQLEGTVISVSGETDVSDPLWAIVLNVVAWTVIFAAICRVASRRSTRRA
ncbi:MULTISPECIES: ABC transporter permease [Citricoccus]|uniref:ABC transporter permease n=1 Tax=Citricoccus TaxID=169133 RepID=UPI000255E017|nr:ABC transporter permease [Citricoccus sp. CH26A]